MAFESVRNRSFPAGSDMSANQFRFVKLDTTGATALASVGGDAIGVQQDKASAVGDPSAVCSEGDITKIVSAGSILAGGNVSSDSTGKAVPSTSGAYILGKALAAMSAGGIYPMLFQQGNSKL